MSAAAASRRWRSGLVSRRWRSGLVGRWGTLAVLASLIVFPLAAADPEEPADKSVPPITLPTDKHAATQLAAAAEYIASKDWKEAVRLLQHVLDGKEEVLIERKAGAGTAWVSARAEARRLLAGLPPAGKEVFEKTYGPEAAELLKQARKLRDREKLARVVRRYLYTAAGPEALEELARDEFRAEEWSAAGRHYRELLRHRGVARWTTEDLYQAALAARRGNGEGPDAVFLRELLARAGAEGLRLGNRTLSREQLRAELEKAEAVKPMGEWLLYRGDAARTNQGLGGPAFLEARWKQPMINTNVKGTLVEQYLQRATRRLVEERKQPVLPAYFPVTATVTRPDQHRPLLMFKNYSGTHAVDMKTGKLYWSQPSNWSLEKMLGKGADGRKAQALQQWLIFYVDQGQRPGILFENSTVGTLSTDNEFVYVVEDFAVPPPPAAMMGFNPGMPGMVPQGGPYAQQDLNEAIRHSHLQAYHVASGKLAWEVGAYGEKNNPLSDSYFLGPPLPLRGLLYVLTQKGKELRLVCLDPRARGKVVSILPLARTAGTLAEDFLRRTQAVHLAYDDGILVVPANAGAVFGVNLQENSVAWAVAYHEPAAAAPLDALQEEMMARIRRGGRLPRGWELGPDGRPMNPNTQRAQWKVTAPAIHDGKVVFTAPDARGLYCVNLHDGALLWKSARQDDDLYFAGIVGGKVLVVGRKSVRALGLAKGETLWTLETGVPSGQGIAAGGTYYLPLREGARGHDPEICAIDMARGAIAGRSRSRAKEVPGNLIFCDGDVISQTAEAVVVYPQLKVKIAQMNELLEKNPNDPAGLFERGELRLDQGDLPGAIDDLRGALHNKPPDDIPGRARARLYDALTDYLQRDFNAAEKHLKEYEELCKVEVPPGADAEEHSKAEKEERRRRNTFLYLAARGREAQGKLLEALKGYLELATQETDKLVPSFEEPAVKVRLDVWARGRVQELLRKANPEQRKQLEEEIERRRNKAEGGRSSAELRAFLALFGPESAAGREARLALAERLIADRDPGALLEAEKVLNALRTPREAPETAARAVETLARLYVRRGLLEDAAYCYRLLGRDYAKVKVRDGKTGSDFYDTAATDKRLMPYLDDPRPTWGGKLKVEVAPGQAMPHQVYHFARIGEPLPFFQRFTLGLNFYNHHLQLVDTYNDPAQPVWDKALTRTFFQAVVQQSQGQSQGHAARFLFRNQGHLVMLPVGRLVYGIDPVQHKLLWERSLAGSNSGNPNEAGWNQLVVDSKDGSLMVLYPDGWAQRLGQAGPLEGAIVCLQTRDGLEALDPLTGKTLWQRADINAHSSLFADDEYVFVVEFDTNNNPNGSRVLRATDGVTVKGVPPFAELYQKRVGRAGRRLLVSDTAAAGAVTLRLYDVLAGKDLWTKQFPPRSIVLHSEDPHLGGIVEPDGKVHVFDLLTQKDVLSTDKGHDLINPKTGMEPAHLANVEGITLLSDGRQIYLACNGQPDANVARFGGIQPNVVPGLGMRSVPVNGGLYAYDRAAGTFQWRMKVPNQMIVLDHFRELPMVLFTSRYMTMRNPGGRGNFTQVASVMSLDKRTGKGLYENKELHNTQFHSLRTDARAGRIDFSSPNLTIRFQAADVPAPKPPH
jgi:outer membrane protein assembly factor BamB